jgi:superfamily II DNA or RNA helicase
MEENLSPYLAKYRQLLSCHRDGVATLPDHLAFEYACAVDSGLLHFSDVPFALVSHLRVKADFGTDLISHDGQLGVQCKHYSQKTVDMSDLSKFICHSHFVLGCTRLELRILPKTNFTKQALDLMDALKDKVVFDVRRASLETLLERTLSPAQPPEPSPEKQTKRRRTRKSAPDTPPPLQPRRVQQRLRETFAAHIGPDPFRAQLPCGAGKTFASGLVLADALAASAEPCLVLVPWLDLLQQTREALGSLLPGTVIGTLDGSSSVVPQSVRVLVATHASLPKLVQEDRQWNLVVLDEAHHCGAGTVRRQQLDQLAKRRLLELSATFPAQMTLDLHVSLREAIDEGIVSDYRLHLVALSVGDRIPALAKLFVEKRFQFGPSLAFFNTTENARRFVAALEASDVPVGIVTVETPIEERQRLKERLASRQLAVVACVGCWNEGVDIPAVHSVVFGDERHSDINKMQVSQRASRLFSGKPWARIVLCVQHTLDDDKAELFRTFVQEDPVLRHACLHQRSGQGQRRVLLELQDGAAADLQQAELLEESLWSSLGQLLDGPRRQGRRGLSLDELCDLFVQHCAAAKPSKGQTVQLTMDGDGDRTFDLSRLWRCVRGSWTGRSGFRGAINLPAELKAKLEAGCPWLQADVTKPSPSVHQRLQWLMTACRDGPPLRRRVLEVQYQDAPFFFKLGEFWVSIQTNFTGTLRRANTSLTASQCELLRKELPWLEEYLASRQQPRLTVQQQVELLIEHHGAARPARRAASEVELAECTFTFKAGQFWHNVCDNFLDLKAHTLLDAAQMQALRDGCTWVPGAIEALQQHRQVRLAASAEAS